MYKRSWGRPKKKVLMRSYAKIQSQVVARGKKVRKVINESKKTICLKMGKLFVSKA
jgi:hypothetical protein